MSVRQPTFLGIGAPKAGTTWLARCLAEHPDVFLVDTKETNFFDWDTVDGRWSEYERHYLNATDEHAVGEVSVRYFASKAAPARAHKYLPDARLFAVIREPGQQLLSHYYHLMRQNFHQVERATPPKSVVEAAQQYPGHLLDPIRYGSNLRRWLEWYPAEQLLILTHDELLANPAAVVRRLYEHVGVDSGFEPPSLLVRSSDTRAGVSPKSGRALKIHQLLYVGIQRFIARPLTRVFGGLAVRRLRNALKVRQLMEKLFFKPGYPQLSAAERKWLDEFFEPERAKLNGLLSEGAPDWTQSR